jgi:DNA polymerase I
LIERYFATYRGVAKGLRSAGDQAVSTGQSRTRLGRLMVFDFDKTNQSEVAAIVRLGKNTPIQGTSADITKRAMMLLNQKLAGTSARLINNIHDELVVEVSADEAEAVAEQLRALMVAAGEEFIKNVPVTVDLKIAEAWLK